MRRDGTLILFARTRGRADPAEANMQGDRSGISWISESRVELRIELSRWKVSQAETTDLDLGNRNRKNPALVSRLTCGTWVE